MTGPRGRERVFLFALAALILAPIGLALWGISTSTISVVVVACAAAVLFVRLPDLTKFKLGPLQAQLEKTVAEANATIAQLRDLAVTLSQASLEALQGMGRLSGDQRHIFAAKERTVRSLTKLGCSAEEIAQATEPFDRWTEFDHATMIRGVAQVQAGNDENAKKAVHACFDFPVTESGISVAKAAQLRLCLEKVLTIGDDLDEAIKDLETFQKTKELRRPEQFFRRYKG